MKRSADSVFDFAFSWINGAGNKGWVTHYRPKHPPLTPEIENAFNYLGLRRFAECPQYDFEPCHWRFTRFEETGKSHTESNAEIARNWFEAHDKHFSPGVQELLTADLALQPFGMNILPTPARHQAIQRMMTQPATRQRTPKGNMGSGPTPPTYLYDVAISFAGPQRELAGALASALRDAGIGVFYDEFYPEHLWGQDGAVVFDSIYRKDSRYCVIFVSREYLERMWTNHERRSAVARQIEEKGVPYILPVKVDDVELPGLQPSTLYLSLDQYPLDQIAEILVRKIRSV